MRIDYALLGYVIFGVAQENLKTVLNLCGTHGIEYLPTPSYSVREKSDKHSKGASSGENGQKKRNPQRKKRSENRMSRIFRKKTVVRHYSLPTAGANNISNDAFHTTMPSEKQNHKISATDNYELLHTGSDYGNNPRDRSCSTRQTFFSCRISAFSQLKKLCDELEIPLLIGRKGGIPLLFHRVRRRYGLFVGAVLAVALFLLARSVLWDIRITSDGVVDQLVLLEELERCGLYPGCCLRNIKTDEVESRMLETSGQIAWITVNIRGTVASVQVRPLLLPESAASSEMGNLIANQDGIVESVKLLAGQVVVKPGQLVRKGELLVSGIRDSRNGGYFFRPADGDVMARVQDTVQVSIPLNQTKKVYTGEVFRKKTLFFFGKALKFSKNTGITGGACDTIYKTDRIDLPGMTRVPILIKTEIERAYSEESVVLSCQEAESMAYAELNRRLIQRTAGGVLLSRRTICTVTEEAVILECYYECLENIAIRLPIPRNVE